MLNCDSVNCEVRQKVGSITSNLGMESCRKCKDSCNSDESLVCAGCAQSYHARCTSVTSLPNLTLKTIKTYSSFKWFCSKCDNAFADVCGRLTLVTQTINANEKINSERFETIVKLINQLEEKISANNNNVLEEIKKGTACKSFSDVVKNSSANENHVVYVKSKSADKNRNETKQQIRNKIDPTKIPIEGMFNAANDGILIKCSDREATQKVSEEIKKSFNDEFEVTIPTAKNPRIKIVNVFENVQISHEALSSKIKSQNTEIFDESSTIKIIKIESNKRNQEMINIIVEIEPKTYQKIMSKKRLLIGWNSCRIYDAIDLKRCFKCSQFGHLGKDCRAETTCCPRCSKQHELKDCKSRTENCINCIRHNKAKNTNLSPKHAAWDNSCPVYQMRLENKKKTIKYQ